MRKTLPLQLRLALIFLWIFVGSCGVSDKSRSVELEKATAKLKQEWKDQSAQAIQDAKKKDYSPKGGFYPQQVWLLKDLLGKAPTKVVELELNRICTSDTLKDYDHEAEVDKNYDYVLLRAFVQWSIERKNGQQLVAILSHHCPQEISYSPLEFRLAYDWPGSIHYLFDCYGAAKSTVAKKELVLCLGRAFPLLRNRYNVDDTFVEQARKWYAENRGNLQINKRYPYIPSQPDTPGKVPQDLFIFKGE